MGSMRGSVTNKAKRKWYTTGGYATHSCWTFTPRPSPTAAPSICPRRNGGTGEMPNNQCLSGSACRTIPGISAGSWAPIAAASNHRMPPVNGPNTWIEHLAAALPAGIDPAINLYRPHSSVLMTITHTWPTSIIDLLRFFPPTYMTVNVKRGRGTELL